MYMKHFRPHIKRNISDEAKVMYHKTKCTLLAKAVVSYDGYVCVNLMVYELFSFLYVHADAHSQCIAIVTYTHIYKDRSGEGHKGEMIPYFTNDVLE